MLCAYLKNFLLRIPPRVVVDFRSSFRVYFTLLHTTLSSLPSCAPSSVCERDFCVYV